MNHICRFGIAIILFFTACYRPVPAVETYNNAPSRSKLSSIDTLMQSHPDSALKALYSCRDTSNVSVSNVSASDRHYYQLLLSEALYKNDSAQQNRPELLEAMAYFDSVDNAFLSARCHYMNGVGYYEMDSVVAACAEYMKALEIMESHFEEKDLTGYKAKFMALAYTHLSGLFSDQYLHEQAIYFGKCALCYYNRYDAKPWHVAWILNHIGSHYDMMEQLDSAEFYYLKAKSFLQDTTILMYRDIETHLAFLSYNKGENTQSALKRLYCLLAQADSETERLSRSSVIGEIFYCEKQLDSALIWLEHVYSFTTKAGLKKSAAIQLKEICESLYIPQKTLEYTNFLAENATSVDHKSGMYSQLSELYESYQRTQHEIQHKQESKKARKTHYLYMSFLIVTIIIVWVFIHEKHRKKVKEQKILYASQQEKFKETHKRLSFELEKTEQEKNALLVKCEKQDMELIQRDTDIRQLKSHIENVKKKKETSDSTDIYRNFRKETVCQSIVSSVCTITIKTERKVSDYKDSALSAISYRKYLMAIDKHSEDFLNELKKQYPNLTKGETKLCCLMLLGLKNKELAVLLQISHQALGKQMRSLLEKTNKNRDGLFASLVNLAFSKKHDFFVIKSTH